MTSISVITNQQAKLNQLLTEHRLTESINLFDPGKNEILPTNTFTIIVNDDLINIPPDWNALRAPIVFPQQLPFTESTFLAIIYLLQGDEEKALLFASKTRVVTEVILAASALQNNLIVQNDFQEYNSYAQFHNAAVLAHNNCFQENNNFENVKRLYKHAIDHTTHLEEKAFTAYHYSILLMDYAYFQEVHNLLSTLINSGLSKPAKLALKYQYCDLLLSLNKVSDGELEALKTLVQELLTLSKDLKNEYKEAMIMLLAADVSELSSHFMESLGCIQKAINYFKREGLEALIGNAYFKKGDLLVAWAHQGNPTMFTKAAESFREALKVFTKENTPQIFAQIHHRLAVIYAEMPFNPEKRAMIAALSVTSFNEALNYFTRTHFPCEYATLCNDFGNAYLKYPESLHTNNYSKAMQYYQEALAIRNKENFPLERSLTLLNYLEACWLMPQGEQLSEGLYEEMYSMAHEVKTLNADEGLVQEAARHLTELAKLKEVINNA